MPLVYAGFFPNAPFLISPRLFGGVGEATATALRQLDLAARWRPDVVLVASPHWVSPMGFRVNDSARPRQIFDFSGFPPELSSVKYAPPGAPELARALVTEGKRRGVPVEATEEWGLDHGAWAPLLHVAPGATIPVVPLSITVPGPRRHLAWGEAIGTALAGRPERVAFLGTGSITHSFRRMRSDPSARWEEGERIEQEIVELVLARRYDDLAEFDPPKWRTIEPEGDLGPLFMVAGAAGSELVPRLVSAGQVHGAFGMTVIELIRPEAAGHRGR